MHMNDHVLGKVFRRTFSDSFWWNLSPHWHCQNILQSTSYQIWDFLPSCRGCLQTLWLEIYVSINKFGCCFFLIKQNLIRKRIRLLVLKQMWQVSSLHCFRQWSGRPGFRYKVDYIPGSIPGRVIPKTLKTVLDTSLLNTQQYKVRIKGKMEQSSERRSALPFTLV